MNATLKWQDIFWARVERYSPILVRLLARDEHGYALSIDEISKASGLPPMEVYYLSEQTSWHGVDIWTMKAFTTACRMSLTDRTQMKRADVYLRGYTANPGHRIAPAFLHLRKDQRLWTNYFRPLLKKYLDHLQAQSQQPRTQ